MEHSDPGLPLLASQLLTDRPTSPGSALAAAMIERALDDLAGRNLHGVTPARAAELRADAARWVGGAPSRLSLEKCCALSGSGSTWRRSGRRSGARSGVYVRMASRKNAAIAKTAPATIQPTPAILLPRSRK